MANKSFVVQYLIKAREQFSAAADKVKSSSEGMTRSVNKSKTAMAAMTVKAGTAVRKLKQFLPSSNRLTNAIKRSKTAMAAFKFVNESVAKSIRKSKQAMTALSVKVGVAAQKLRQVISPLASIRAASVKARASIKALEQRFEKLTIASQKIRNVGLALSVGVTLPLGLMAVSFKNAARDAIETRTKFATVFKDITQSSEQSADNLAKNFGLTGTKARELLGNTGDLLSGFGFTGEAALTLSTQVNELAVDLASFTNFSGGAEGASAALTKALLGERESLKTLGIAILEKDVKAKVSQLLAEGQTFATLRQAKAQATLLLAVEQSENAMGDFGRTQHELANQERITSSRIQDLKESFGKALLPVALKITKAIRSMAKRLTALSPATKKTILIVAGLVAVLGPLLLLIGGIGLAIPAIATGFIAVGTAASLAFGPLGILIAAIALGAVLIIKNWSKVKAFFSGFASAISAKFGPTLTRLVSQFKEAARIIANLFGADSEAATNLTNFANIGTLIGDIVGGALTTIVRGISGVGALLGQIIGAVATLDFSAFDISAIKAELIGTAIDTSAAKAELTEAIATSTIKAELVGTAINASAIKAELAKAPVIDISGRTSVDVGVNVGLDQGLKQTSTPSVSSINTRRTDVGSTVAAI